MKFKIALLFGVLCVFWGIPYFLIKIALVELSPLFVAWSRITLAASVLIPLAWWRGTLAQTLRYPFAILTFATMELIIPFSLIAYAERSISSSTTGVLIAGSPLLVVIIAPWMGVRETLSARRLLGVLVGLIGVAMLLGFDAIAGRAQWLAVGAILFAVVAYAVAPLVVQRYLGGVSEIGAAATSLGVASALLFPFAAVSAPHKWPSGLSSISIGTLGLVSTACAMLLFFHVIRAIGAARASLVSYISPAIAASLGVLILHEHFEITMMIGFALILLGSALGSSGGHALDPNELDAVGNRPPSSP